jgi:hypothetical protein
MPSASCRSRKVGQLLRSLPPVPYQMPRNRLGRILRRGKYPPVAYRFPLVATARACELLPLTTAECAPFRSCRSQRATGSAFPLDQHRTSEVALLLRSCVLSRAQAQARARSWGQPEARFSATDCTVRRSLEADEDFLPSVATALLEDSALAAERPVHRPTASPSSVLKAGT